MPLFRRCDGELVKNIDPIRRMMPFIMRGRNDSIIYHTTQWDIAEARAWLRHYNRTRRSGTPATFSHLVAYACIKMLHARPGLNRFVSGGRIYQRKGVWLSFAAKIRFTDEAPLTTVKLPFAAGVRFDECVEDDCPGRQCRALRTHEPDGVRSPILVPAARSLAARSHRRRPRVGPLQPASGGAHRARPFVFQHVSGEPGLHPHRQRLPSSIRARHVQSLWRGRCSQKEPGSRPRRAA